MLLGSQPIRSALCVPCLTHLCCGGSESEENKQGKEEEELLSYIRDGDGWKTNQKGVRDYWSDQSGVGGGCESTETTSRCVVWW